MKFTLEWLKEHLDTHSSLTDIIETLTDIGLEVEAVEDPTAKFDNFTVCRVQSAVQHPNADRLKLCMVEYWPNGPKGASETLQVVCGAPNAKAGLIGIFAPIGSYIPGTGLNLKKGKIRGQESNGMLCSERELEISDEHDGIIELDASVQLGAKFAKIFNVNDPVIEIAVTPNRPDALGIRGIARDLTARGLGTLKPLTIPQIKGQFKSPIRVLIDEELKAKACPVFMGRVIRGVTNDPSPNWLKNRLKAIGLRPISTLVDVTNYITYELGRPLHVFDADKVVGDLHVHLAAGGEKITALDGNEYFLNQDMIVISDDNGPESIAGVMGGESTGCTEETQNVFIESALWDPISIAETGRKLKINSDARYRFERGVDPQFTEPGLAIATQLILDLCGGEASELVFDGQVPVETKTLNLSINQVNQLVGLEVSTEQQVRILDRLGFNPILNQDEITAHVPSWRPDIGDNAVDLVEEIARIASLTKLTSKPMAQSEMGVTQATLTPLQKREQITRRMLANLGYSECVTYSFVDRKFATLFVDEHDLIDLDNPISSEMDVMRPDLLPGLLKSVAKNQSRGNHNLQLFEVGPVFYGAGPGEQLVQACGVIAGSFNSLSPHAEQREVDVFDAKSDMEQILNMIGPKTQFRLIRHKQIGWHPERTGGIFLKPGEPLGWYGQVHSKVLRAFKIVGPVVGFTLLLDALPFSRKRQVAREPLQASDLQAIERDFSFIVDNKVEAQTINQAVKGSKFRDRINSVQIFDEFSGPAAESQFTKGKKSLAFRVKFYPQENEDIEALIAKLSEDIEQRVTKATKGTLRQI